MDNDQQNNQYGYPVPPEMPPSYTPPVGKGMAIASMVLGIVSITFSWAFFIGFIFAMQAIVGIVLAVVSKKRCAAAGLRPYGVGTAGLVLNIIGLVFNVLGTFGCAVLALAFYVR